MFSLLKDNLFRAFIKIFLDKSFKIFLAGKRSLKVIKKRNYKD